MTLSPLPLESSGRRPSAGPGRQSGPQLYIARPIASLVVVGLAATLMVGPSLIAVLPAVVAGRLAAPSVPAIMPIQLVAMLEVGRALLTVVLAAKIVRTTELE
jgi:hypothetical protein